MAKKLSLNSLIHFLISHIIIHPALYSILEYSLSPNEPYHAEQFMLKAEQTIHNHHHKGINRGRTELKLKRNALNAARRRFNGARNDLKGERRV